MRIIFDISLHDRIKKCRLTIARWRREENYNTQKILEELKDKLDKSQVDQSLSTAEVSAIHDQLQKAYEEEEDFWQQKSRNLWFKKGERNTKFYHATTKQRRARNHISGLNDSRGIWCENERKIKTIAVEYFSELFSSSTPSDIKVSLNHLERTISPEMNESLCKEISPAEKKKSSLLHPSRKSSRPRWNDSPLLPEVLGYCQRRPNSYG